jgi:hypothetical protein
MKYSEMIQQLVVKSALALGFVVIGMLVEPFASAEMPKVTLQEQLDAEVAESGGYEITAEEFAAL